MINALASLSRAVPLMPISGSKQVQLTPKARIQQATQKHRAGHRKLLGLHFPGPDTALMAYPWKASDTGVVTLELPWAVPPRNGGQVETKKRAVSPGASGSRKGRVPKCQSWASSQDCIGRHLIDEGVTPETWTGNVSHWCHQGSRPTQDG